MGPELDRKALRSLSYGLCIVTSREGKRMNGQIVNMVILGSHTIFVADVLSTEVLKPGRPLTFHYYHEHLKGKPPKNAPTYAPAKQP